jgi:hypothetical protein
VLNQWDPGSQSCNFRILIGPAGQNRGLPGRLRRTEAIPHRGGLLRLGRFNAATQG